LEHLSAAPFSARAANAHLGQIDGLAEEKKKQIARDFESIFLTRLLDEMKNTIGDWGFDKEGVSEQVHGIFWLYLARHISNSGGFGLWKNIHQFLNSPDKTNAAIQSVDRNV